MRGQVADDALKTFLDERERLISLACQIVASRAVAEELVQDSWIRWDQRSYPTEKALPIFRKIVANLARDWRRRQSRESQLLKAHAMLQDEMFDAEKIVIAREDLSRIVAALEQLPDRTVRAFQMSRLEGLTYAEIANRLETVPSRIHGYIVKALAQIALALMD